MKVKLHRGQLNTFRSKARAVSPKELIAYLVGSVVSKSCVRVDSLVYPELETQKHNEVAASVEAEEDTLIAALESGQRVVGSIHSHPNYWPILSKADHESHIQSQDRVSGVYAWMGRRSQVVFWVTESSLPADIEFF